MDQASVSLVIAVLEIIEKPPPLSYEFQEASTGVVVFDMNFEVPREVINALAEQSNLNFRRPGITVVELELLDNLTFLLLRNPHVSSLCLFSFLLFVNFLSY